MRTHFTVTGMRLKQGRGRTLARRSVRDHNWDMEITTCPSCKKKNRVPVAAGAAPKCGHCKAALPWLVNATDSDFEQAAATKLPVVVDLWAPWCGPCRMVAPILEKVSKKYAGALKVVKVNVDQNPALQARFQAQSIPTMLLLKDGKVAARQVGAMPQPQLESWLSANGVKPL